MPRVVSVIITGVVILSVMGFMNASFLTYRYYFAGPPPCTIQGCETVTTSEYAEIAGVSVALLGALYYLSLAALSAFLLNTPKRGVLFGAFLISSVGLLMSIWFTYVQLFILKAICIYCFFSAVETFIIFILLSIILARFRNSLGYT